MTKAITAFELDLDRCSLTFGVGACKAQLAYADGSDFKGATFDGSADYLRRVGGLTGAADSKLWTASVWIRPDLVSVGGRIVAAANSLAGAANGARVTLGAGGTNFTLYGTNAAGTDILNINSSALVPGKLNHCLVSVDLANTSNRHIYINGVSDLAAVVTYVNDTIDFTKADWAIAAGPNASSKFGGELSELWFAPGVYIDFSIAANREKFRDSEGRPVDLGATGSAPTGTAPLVYMKNIASTLGVNAGTGGNFTLNGAVEEAVVSTGTKKCFNALGTCQDRVDFDNVPQTLRYLKPSEYLPADLEGFPFVTGYSFSPAIISLGKDLGQRASLELRLGDSRHGDTGLGGDPYPESRDYVPFDTGTYFGRFRARQRYLRGRKLRLLQGTTDMTSVSEYDNFHFIMESFQGPSIDGQFSITSKDLLKLLDGDRAQAPLVSPGSLEDDISATDLITTVVPAGAGDSYPSSGLINLGGTETALYVKDPLLGNNANTKLLLHAEGPEDSTTIIDSSIVARTMTANGNARLRSNLKKFGNTAIAFDGSGDYVTAPDSADWAFGTSNFTVDFWANVDDIAFQRTFFCQQTDANNRQQLFVTTGGAISYTVTSASSTIITLTSAGGVIAPDTWYHIALVRDGNDFDIYVDGVSVASVTDTSGVPNYSGVFTIGMQGTVTNAMQGAIDEFRVQSGAFWTSAFTPPTIPYLRTNDDFYLTARGQYNSTAVSHSGGDRVQLCLVYLGVDPADAAYDLCTNYGQIPVGNINLSDWQAETDAYYGATVSTVITEPTAVKTLLSELIEQVGMAMWWDVVNERVRLRVLREIPTDAQVYDETLNILDRSIRVTEQPDKRISQVWVFFGRSNPLKGLADKDNYRSVTLVDDLDEEENWGQPAIKIIYSRWIAFGGADIADNMAYKQLGRYRIPPRMFEFQVHRRGSVVPELGGGARLLSSILQTDEGKPDNVPIQFISVNPGDAVYSLKAEEQLFTDLNPIGGDGFDYVTYDNDNYNINLLTSYTSLYGAPVKGDKVIFTINQNVIIGSTSTANPAIDVGAWPNEAATGNRTSGSPTLASVTPDPVAAGWAAGMFVRGTGIPNGAKILSVTSTSITLDANASSGAGTATALTVYTVPVTLRVKGRIQGKGGQGGQGGTGFTNPTWDGKVGLPGGLALKSLSTPINLDLSDGDAEIFGGGGGGGGAATPGYTYGDGGGGGAGFDPGAGGAIGGTSGPGGEQPGSPGSTEAGGAKGVNSLYGGSGAADGGGPGLVGGTAPTFGGGRDGGVGGAAGGAIDGVSFTKKTGTGDIRGTQIN